MLGIAAGGILAIAPAAQAAVILNISVPIAPLQPTVINPCNDDIIALTGDVHILVSFTINGNRISGMTHIQPQGVSGTDQTTGAEYQGTGVTQDEFSGSLTNGQYEETFINRFDFLGQGSAPNFREHETAHVTFNANGTVTANFDNFSISCG
jgi:hypothetical protein